MALYERAEHPLSSSSLGSALRAPRWGLGGAGAWQSAKGRGGLGEWAWPRGGAGLGTPPWG